jgi:lipid II:glycine glycyltransferase (peptidoglycan interpeptide bridge formation enzyme)
MIHASNIMAYNMANDGESFNKEMASDSLEWHVMLSANRKTGAVLMASRVMKVCGLHIG